MRIQNLILFCSLLLITPSFASATTMFHVSDIEQARQSDAVIVATVGTSKTAIHPNKKSIMTETNIFVEEVLTGNAPRFLTIRQMGGTLDGKTMYVPGDARLSEGSKVVLFIGPPKKRSAQPANIPKKPLCKTKTEKLCRRLLPYRSQKASRACISE